jgi:signal transduction histidine kinase
VTGARQLRVLIVEDSDPDAELCVQELQRAGYEVEADIVGDFGLYAQKIRKVPYDIILSDYGLKGWTGMDAFLELRHSGKEIPFILVTSSIGEEAAVDHIKRGFTDYVIKDRLARLPVAVRRALEETEREENQKRISQELWASESKLRMVLSQLPAIIWTTDRDLHMTSLTGAGLAALPESRGQRGWLPLDEAAESPPPSVVAHRRALAGESVEFESDFEGRAYWNRVEPLRDLAGTVTGCLGLALDITERRALEHQLLQAQKFEAIGQLAGGIAHDFNNVLAAILGMAELGQLEAPEGTRIRERLQKICHHAGRAVALTRQLLAFSRRQQLEQRPINLNLSVNEVTSLISESLGKDVEVNCELAPELSSVFADAGQIEQVLINLCVNARDAMPSGGRLTIATSNVSLDEEACRSRPGISAGEFVRLTVTDTGSGMDAETLGRIFEPFFTTKPPGRGTGLGLATVYGVVKQHGGCVDVASAPGQGTTFQLHFPVSQSITSDPARPGEAQPVRGGTETILLAEDHAGLRELVCESLESLGYSVLAACDGEEAIELFRRHAGKVDLLILDVVMPRLRGPDAYKRIRDLNGAIPVLFCTGYNSDSAQVEILSGHPVLQKPYRTRELARTVRLLLDQRSRPAN